jgi:transcriptional regulator with XRE-family HTH domain
MSTKLQKLLDDHNLTQGDFIKKIKEKTGFRFDRGNISKLISGKSKNYTIKTAIIISKTLNCKIDDFVEKKL